jgi:molybdopterin-guanine dinucleotide biosynthesis protein A
MGRSKASLPFGGETLLERVLRIVAPQVDDVILAAAPAQSVPAGFGVVRDPGEGRGPLPALLRALPHVRHDCAFVVACDTPLLQPAIIAMLVRLSEGWEACVPLLEGVMMTTCAVYRPEAVLAAARREGDPFPSSLHGLVQKLRVRMVPPQQLREADPELLSFKPCNTPEEYRQALRLAGLAA